MVKQNQTSSVIRLPDCLEVVVQDQGGRAIGRPWMEVVVQDQGFRAIGWPWVEVVVQDQGARAIGRPLVEMILVHADQITLVEPFMVMA